MGLRHHLHISVLTWIIHERKISQQLLIEVTNGEWVSWSSQAFNLFSFQGKATSAIYWKKLQIQSTRESKFLKGWQVNLKKSSLLCSIVKVKIFDKGRNFPENISSFFYDLDNGNDLKSVEVIKRHMTIIQGEGG